MFFFNNSSDFSSSGSSQDLDDLSGELESSDGDDLSLDAFTIDQDSLVAEDIDNGGELSRGGTESDSDNATDFDESAVALNRPGGTISQVVVKYIKYKIMNKQHH